MNTSSVIVFLSVLALASGMSLSVDESISLPAIQDTVRTPEEKTRSEGDSGLKITRLRRVGPRPYQAESHAAPTEVCLTFYYLMQIINECIGHVICINLGTEKENFSSDIFGDQLFQVAAIHNHANNIRTVGMGEFVAVLNGVEFRTRHNDYRLNMPSTTSTEYHKTEEIPFPDVPPEVLQHTDVSDQATIASIRN